MRTSEWLVCAGTALVLVWVTGCTPPNRGSACTPNATVSCACPAAASGLQTCNEQGSGFTSPCVCGGGRDAGPGGSGDAGSCSCAAGQVCGTNACGGSCGTCPFGSTCNGRTCDVTPPMCQSQVGDVCTTNVECCGNAAGTATCVNYGGALGTRCGATCTSGATCSSGCCTPLTTGGGACAPATYCVGGTGDACTSTTQCPAADYCATTLGYCSRTCSSSGDCNGIGSGGVNTTNGEYNFCIRTTGASDCRAGCATNADCTAYPGTYCRTVTGASGASLTVCSN